jgi:UDP-N-acetylglucosamine 2-epimerase (non-hydrolysing)
MPKLLLVAGARPNFMKVAPVIREIQRRAPHFEYRLVHTGQHYDEGMSDVFFRDLGIPKPQHHLNVGSGSHAVQTAKIMTAFEPVLDRERPDCVLVVGDVNSTLACSIVAKKQQYKVGHVEAGLRSRDLAMPEEINRMVTDAISDYFFVTEKSGVENLLREGHGPEHVYFVGHVMIDNLFYELEQLERADASKFISTLLKREYPRYGVVTLHRPSNVDDRATLSGICDGLSALSQSIPLIFPVHPRTRARLDEFALRAPPKLHLLEPLGYRDFLNLMKDAAVVLTDSGGLQEETTALGIPCLTIRENTERPITVTEGTNRIVGTSPRRIMEEGRAALAAVRATPVRPEKWDGQASVRILDALARVL